MAIIPLRIVFENFLAFKNQQEFIFSHKGIHYIYGVDYTIDPELGFKYEDYSVGVGKTSLAMAMQFAIYGRIQKKINKDTIINKHSKRNLFIQFDFVANGNEYRIERYRKHFIYDNNVFLYQKINDNYVNISYNDIRQTQNEIQRIVGLDIRTFEKSVLFTRDEKIQFLELSTIDRGTIFENLAQINKLQEYADNIKQKLKSTNNILEKYNIDILTLTTIIKKDKQYLEQLQNDFIKQKKELEHKIQELQKKVNVITSLSIYDIKQLLAQYTTLQTQCDGYVQSITAQEKIIANHNALYTNNKQLIAKYNDKIKSLKQKIKNLQPITCYQCGAIQNKDEYLTIQNNLQLELQQHKKEINEIQEKQNILSKELQECTNTLKQYKTLYTATSNELETIKTKIPFAILENPDIVNDLEQIHNEIQAYTIQLQSLSIDAKRQELEYEIIANTEKLTELQNKKNDITSTIKMLELWNTILDFKTEHSIKQYIISKLIPLFNNLLQQIVDVVYRGDMVITFDNFFNETIIYKNDVATYDELSTGEKAKLNFCIYLAIFDLTRINLNGINIIFLDEIFNNIDIPTIKTFISVITQRYANDNGVYIISHQNEVKENLYPQSIIRIEKYADGSKIIYEKTA